MVHSQSSHSSEASLQRGGNEGLQLGHGSVLLCFEDGNKATLGRTGRDGSLVLFHLGSQPQFPKHKMEGDNRSGLPLCT